MSTNTLRRELAHRNSNGVNVSLYWDGANNTLGLEVRDERLQDFFKLCVPSDRALDAFHHPYADRAQSRTEDRESLAA
jgi:hypothetical protein